MNNHGSRLLLAVSCILAVLLLALAVIQYRWAGRLAEAEAERASAQLRSSAGLFARDFDLRLAQTYVALQTEAALQGAHSHQPPALNRPPLIQDLYLLSPARQGTQLLQETSVGTWSAIDSNDPVAQRILKETALDNGRQAPACDSRVLDNAAAMLIPLPSNRATVVIRGPQSEQEFARAPTEMRGRCIYATLNQRFLRQSVFPDLIRKHFGADAAAKYDFRVVSRANRSQSFFHTVANALPDSSTPALIQPVFAMRLEDLLHDQMVAKAAQVPRLEGARLFIHAIQTHSIRDVIRPGSSLAQTGVWQLEVNPKAGPLGWLNLWRQQNLLLSLGVELLLLASIGFLLISTRRMQRLAGQKMQFVAGVSHELRNPLAAIAMLSRNQEDGLVRTSEQVRQYGSLIHEQARRLTEMVEKTLQYAGIQSGLRTRDLASVNVGRIVEQALASRKTELDQAGFEVEVNIQPDLPAVAGDAQALQQAIENLLSNAVKYAEAGRWIRVKAAPAEGGETVCITVEDRGPGVDPSEADQIFEPFYRGRSAVDAQIPGSGLGLSLVRSTAKAHHGAVVFAQVPNSGSSFTIRLPAR